MIKLPNVFLLMQGIIFASILQATVPIFMSENLKNLESLKTQFKDSVVQEFVFDVFSDCTKTSTIKRHGILIKRPYALGTVLICHGYLGSKDDSLGFRHLFPLYNVMVFDFRAHGQDRQGQVSTIGRDEALDVIAAVNCIRRDPLMQHKPVIAYGFSMGAVSAIQAQSIDPTLFDAMILDCPYDSTDAAMIRGLDERLRWSLCGYTITLPGKNFIVRHMYDEKAQYFTNMLFQSITSLDSNKVATKFVKVEPVEAIKNVTVPCFFIHCEHDKKVPIHAVERIYHNKPGFKRLWITQGKSHFGSYAHNPEMYWYKVNKFLTKLRTQDITKRKQTRVCDQRTVVSASDDQRIPKFL